MQHSIIEPETARLKLRQWQEKDKDAFAKLSTDPQVMEYFPSTLDREASDALANRCQSLIAERGFGLWAVELKQTEQFIGVVGLHTPSADLPFSPCVEIGWRLAVDYWGKGLAMEAAQAALAVGFNQLGLTEIVAFTTLKNKRSQALMKRLGMNYSGEFDHPAVPADSSLVKHCLYRLSKEEWQAYNKL